MAATDDASIQAWLREPETQEKMRAAVEATYPAPTDEAENANTLTTALLEEINSPRPSTNRRILLAQLADLFFSVKRSAQIAAQINKPDQEGTTAPWCVKDFLMWVGQQGLHPPEQEVMRVLLAMEQQGLLFSGGYQDSEQVLGQIFWSVREDPARSLMPLWLAEVFGGEVVIPFYNSATVLITGNDINGKPETGSGLVLGPWLIVTNRHVVEGIVADIEIVVPEQPAGVALGRLARPSVVIPIHKSQIVFEKRDPEDIDRPRDDLDVDVAVIQLITQPMWPMLQPLLRMTFRDPRWGDAAYVFGYPRVHRTTMGDITVHGGKVVNPAEDVRKLKVEPGEVVHPGTEVYDPPERSRVLLYSSIARPGTSGGPIVAADGHLIGLVVQHSAPAASSDVNKTSDDDKLTSAPFYFGIPSSEVIRAVKRFEIDELARVSLTLIEDWT